MAVRDTVLPLGGGPNGNAPILVKSGTNIAFHVTALHRRRDLWGEDAEEFRPERWNNLHAAWVRKLPPMLTTIACTMTYLMIVIELSTVWRRPSQLPWPTSQSYRGGLYDAAPRAGVHEC